MSTITSTVEETNRQRIALGLAPLASVTAADASRQASEARASVAAEAAERESVERIRAELARRKEKRLVHARVAGQSLGESLVSQTAGSAREWIERSRRLGLSEQQKAAQTEARAREEEHAHTHADYTSEQLAGVKVGHSAADFARGGEEVILTLKDTGLLVNGGAGVSEGLNEEEDELLNADLVEQAKQKEITARRAQIKSGGSHRQGLFDAHADEEAELLAKYSDAKESASLRLGSRGQLSAAELDFQSNSALYAQDEARKQLNQLVYSLDDGAGTLFGAEKERTYQSDFKEVKFKKKKNNGKAGAAAASEGAEAAAGGEAAAASAQAGDGTVAMKKKGARRRDAHTKAPTASVLDFLPEPSEAERAAELSGRGRGGASGGPPLSAMERRLAQENAAMQADKDARYARAREAAAAATSARNALDIAQGAEEDARRQGQAQEQASFGGAAALVPPPPSSAPPASAFAASSAAPVGGVPPPPPGLPPASALPMPSLEPPPGLNLFEEEDDELLAQSLAKARRLAAKSKKAVKRQQDDDEAEDMEVDGAAAATAASAASAAASSAPVDSVRALAEMVNQKRAEDEIRVKTEPTSNEEDSATAATAGAASGLPARSAPPGMRVKKEADNIVFTATTEFVRGLQFEREEQEARRVKKEQQDGAAAAAGHAAAAAVSSSAAAASAGPAAMELDSGDESKAKAKGKGVTVEDEVKEADEEEEGGDQGSEEEDEGDDDDEADGLGGLRSDEPYAATGVAAALRLYKQRGVLKEGGIGGRKGAVDGGGGDNFNLERYDAFGRPQSKKEQFRALSHKFHGIEPGLKKKEKRLQRVQEEALRLQALRESGGVADLVQERTRALGSAHVVMDKKLGAVISAGRAGVAAATTAAAAAGGGGGAGGEDQQQVGQKRKHAGPFAQFGFGAAKQRRKIQDAQAKAKAAKAAADAGDAGAP